MGGFFNVLRRGAAAMAPRAGGFFSAGRKGTYFRRGVAAGRGYEAYQGAKAAITGAAGRVAPAMRTAGEAVKHYGQGMYYGIGAVPMHGAGVSAAGVKGYQTGLKIARTGVGVGIRAMKHYGQGFGYGIGGVRVSGKNISGAGAMGYRTGLGIARTAVKGYRAAKPQIQGAYGTALTGVKTGYNTAMGYAAPRVRGGVAFGRAYYGSLSKPWKAAHIAGAGAVGGGAGYGIHRGTRRKRQF